MKPARYVYERIWEDRDELAKLFVEGAGRVYVCGSNRLSKSAQEVCIRIVRERNGVSEQEAKEWFEKQKGLRSIETIKFGAAVAASENVVGAEDP
ncbi:hypothetical protein HK097_003472 [Rhizophlyctis rosea]|uniref:Uncharacterized protein n=1 Tax=Rhizophlyctis rosea TaxID=64517 RepID=A0AAD5WX76_9FUNG|nr:hypothetical protein HK097_003472 [Rhizophlyctis rosea]